MRTNEQRTANYKQCQLTRLIEVSSSHTVWAYGENYAPLSF